MFSSAPTSTSCIALRYNIPFYFFAIRLRKFQASYIAFANVCENTKHAASILWKPVWRNAPPLPTARAYFFLRWSESRNMKSVHTLQSKVSIVSISEKRMQWKCNDDLTDFPIESYPQTIMLSWNTINLATDGVMTDPLPSSNWPERRMNKIQASLEFHCESDKVKKLNILQICPFSSSTPV